MYSPPYIFFHSRVGYWWKDGTDPALQKLRTLNDAPKDLLPSLAINVSQPKALMTWLETNNAALITNITIILDAHSNSSSPPLWCQLFDKLQQEETNIQHLSICWDSDGPWGQPKPWGMEDFFFHYGLGRSVVFLRGLAQLKVKEKLEISGFYAKHWPRYLEEKMGLRPVERLNVPGSWWERSLKDYQDGTERFDPWTNTKDVKFTFRWSCSSGNYG